MRPQFSEFSFAYALTEALLDTCPFRVQPIFPTQRQEGRPGGGYDVRLDVPGFPLFLQFELCKGVTRRHPNSAETHPNVNIWPNYLRMDLMPEKRSPQHQLLLDLSRTEPNVFYCAPRFFEYCEFRSHWTTDSVLRYTAFIRPNSIGVLPDRNAHHISFSPQSNYGYLCSEPKEVESILSGEELVKEIHVLASESRDGERSLYQRLCDSWDHMRSLREKTIASPDSEEAALDIDLSESPIKFGLFAHLYFNVFVFLVSTERMDASG